MRVLFWILLLVVVALTLALATSYDAGYVRMVYPPWQMEMSLPLFLGGAVLLFFLAYFLIRLLTRLLRLPGGIRDWRGRRSKLRADDLMSRAISALLAEQPEHALKLAKKMLKREDSTLGVLVAGHAALGAGDRIAAREYMGRVETQVGELVAARQVLERALAIKQETRQTAPPALEAPEPKAPRPD